jgi:CRISPR-associated protein Cas5t
MQAVKIVAEGVTTSFRYPHFIQGVHLTFEMPPPATIYGHICSAVGDYIPRHSTRFAYHFRYDAKFEDYEHLHFFGKEAKMNPFTREQLFRPQLTLYLDNVDLLAAFKSPRYPVVLGRSQDLMSYSRVEIVDLQQAQQAFYSGTLIPLEQSALLDGDTYAVTMPRFLNEKRQPEWGQYAVLNETRTPPIYPTEDGLQFETRDPWEIWIDPQPDAAHPYLTGLQRGVIWHDW